MGGEKVFSIHSSYGRKKGRSELQTTHNRFFLWLSKGGRGEGSKWSSGLIHIQGEKEREEQAGAHFDLGGM